MEHKQFSVEHPAIGLKSVAGRLKSVKSDQARSEKLFTNLFDKLSAMRYNFIADSTHIIKATTMPRTTKKSAAVVIDGNSFAARLSRINSLEALSSFHATESKISPKTLRRRNRAIRARRGEITSALNAAAEKKALAATKRKATAAKKKVSPAN